jgi:hypothetical protein
LSKKINAFVITPKKTFELCGNYKRKYFNKTELNHDSRSKKKELNHDLDKKKELNHN